MYQVATKYIDDPKALEDFNDLMDQIREKMLQLNPDAPSMPDQKIASYAALYNAGRKFALDEITKDISRTILKYLPEPYRSLFSDVQAKVRPVF